MALTRVALSGMSLGVQVTPTSRKKSFMCKKRASSERVEKCFHSLQTVLETEIVYRDDDDVK